MAAEAVRSPGDLFGQAGQVDRDHHCLAVLETGGGKKSIDHRSHSLGIANDDLPGGDPLLHRRSRVIKRHLDVAPDYRQRRPQVMGGVGQELPLRLEGAFQTVEHSVESRGKPGEFVVGPGQRDTTREVGCLDLAGHLTDPVNRCQRPAGDHPADDEADEEEQADGHAACTAPVDRARTG